MILLIIIAVPLLIMGIITLIGKGDNLIAGYNIASEKEKMQYNIKRLRGLIGGMLIMLALLTVILLGLETMIAALSYAAITIALCIAVIILANTWAKKIRTKRG